MVKKQFENELLKQKKARFLVTVKRVAIAIGKPIPPVFFGNCPEKSKNELAHIHKKENIICISDESLAAMTYDDITNTTTHEVNHLLDTRNESNPNHSYEFYNRHDALIIATWKPPPGVEHYTISKLNKNILSKPEKKRL